MVGLVEIAVDGGLEVDDGAEHAALQSALGERGEEGFDGVEPGARGRGEVEGEARVAGEPGQHVSPSQAPTARDSRRARLPITAVIRRRMRDVGMGAAMTALLFTAGKFVIGYYIGKSGVASAYGAAASIITLLLWIYYSSLILLFGAEFTKAYAESRGIGQRSLRGEEHQT